MENTTKDTYRHRLLSPARLLTGLVSGSASAKCAGCGHKIQNTQERVRIFLAPDPDADDRNEGKTNGVFAGMGGSPKSNGAVSFSDLPNWLKRKFQVAGLGNGRGSRTLAEAEELFQQSVPRDIRNMGVKAVAEFLRDKVASHKESVANAPGKTKIPGNILWEKARRNFKRGPANMKVGDKLHAHASNGADNARILGRHALGNAGKATLFAVLTELPVSAIEGAIHVAKGKRSRGEAAKETASNTARAGIAGGVTAAGVTMVTAFGAGPALAAIYPVVVPVSAALLGYRAYRRIRGAAQDSPHLKPVPLYFHASCPECTGNQTCAEMFTTKMNQ